MSSPSAKVNELDGGLGILPSSAGPLQALIGTAQSGPLNTPVAYASAPAVQSTFGVAGPLVEAACYAIEHYGAPVVLVRATGTTAGTTSDLVTTGVAGTSVVTIDGTVHPADDAEVGIVVLNGGTIGVAGITIQYTYDNFRTLSPVTALGTANTFTVPNSIKFNFAAGTLLANDKVTATAHAPVWLTADLQTALDALIASTQPWEYVTILGDATGAVQDAVDARMATAHNGGKHRWAQIHFRMPNVGESDSAYQTAASTSFLSHTSTSVERYAGAAKVLSSVSAQQRRRSPIFPVAPLYASVTEEKDIAKKLYGPLPGVQIRDDNGNLDEHDEFEEPGLDDLKFTTLRTWPNGNGAVYVNNPRIACPVGSDFVLVQYRRVMNLARTVLQAYLETRVNDEILVDASTGFILESEARDIESGANATLETALLNPGKASSAVFVLSRTDNLLSTQTLTYQVRVVPLGYAKTITGTIAFNNPALRVIQG